MIKILSFILTFIIALNLHGIYHHGFNTENILVFDINKDFSIVFLTTATINLSLIGGRIGYITFFVLLSFVIILQYRKKAIKPLIIFICSFIILANVAYNYSNTFKLRIDTSINTINTIKEDNSSLNSSFGLRLGFWLYSKDVILDNFLFNITSSQMSIIASDLETTMISSINVEADVDGKITIPARILIDTLKTFSNQPLTFIVDATTFGIEMSSELGNYKLAGQNANEFPKTPKLNGSSTTTIKGDILALIKSTDAT